MKLQGWTVVKEQLFPSKEKKSCKHDSHDNATHNSREDLTWEEEWHHMLSGLASWLKWQILTAIQPPQLLRSVTWRVHTWRMFSLLPDNHSSTILLGPYTTKPIFPTTLRIILHFSASSYPDLMKIHRNKVYHTKLIGPHSHFTWYKWDNLDGQAPNVITDEFAISNFQLWTQKQDLVGMATFGKLILTSGKSRRPRSTEELIFHIHMKQPVCWDENAFSNEESSWMAMGAKTHWPWTCHVLQTKVKLRALTIQSSRIFTWNTCLTRSLACSGIAEQ